MDMAIVCLLLLKQGAPSRTLILACLNHCLEHSVCIFLHTSLNERSKACLTIEGPRGSFTAYVEWVLAQCDSLFTVCPVDEDIASPDSTPEPDPS